MQVHGEKIQERSGREGEIFDVTLRGAHALWRLSAAKSHYKA